MAVQTDARREPTCRTSCTALRTAIEAAVPHGRTDNGGTRRPRRVARASPAAPARGVGASCEPGYERHRRQAPERSARATTVNHLGTLGTGNHFIEVCLDEDDRVWVMLHSGSRGVGNRIGTLLHRAGASATCSATSCDLPDRDLAYFQRGQPSTSTTTSRRWAGPRTSRCANRELMMDAVVAAVRGAQLPRVRARREAVNCHHNYVAREHHFGEDVCVTRKGAVRARAGRARHHPGVDGRARATSCAARATRSRFCSCSHGAGRAMSRGEAKRRFTVEDHARGDRGRRVPQGRGRDRRDPGGVQGHRRA